MQCFPKPFDNFVNSVGVVGGTVDLFLVLSFLAIIPVMYAYLWITRWSRPLSPVEVDELTDAVDDQKESSMKEIHRSTLGDNILISKMLLKIASDDADRENLLNIIANAEKRLKEIDDDDCNAIPSAVVAICDA